MNAITSSSSTPPVVVPAAAKTDTAARASNIPWGAYWTTYFVQAVIMAMILDNVPVFLRRGLDLEWIGLAAVYAAMFAPVLLRPVFAGAIDQQVSLLTPCANGGILLVIAGSMSASIGAPFGASGLPFITAGFAVAVVGATLLNVVADSHIIRAVSLAESAKVNARKRVWAFVGLATGQVAFALIVGTDYARFDLWAFFFTIPAVVAAGAFGFLHLRQRGQSLWPNVEHLPPRVAPWIQTAIQPGDGAISTKITSGMILVGVIAFLYCIPEGLMEATFENYLMDTYSASAFLTYKLVMILGGIVMALGFVWAGRGGKKTPEWDLLWFVPIAIAFYLFVWSRPAFPVLLLVDVVMQVTYGFIQVRLLQLWQGHSYTHHPALTFQAFIATYQFGKIAGIGLSGLAMTAAGYRGVFLGSIIAWIATLGITLIFFLKNRKS